MIITRIIGGLGNQMFQYATGRALSLRYHKPLLLDLSGFENYRLHQGFELQRVFNCGVDIADDSVVCDILGWQCLPIVRRILTRPSMKMLRRQEFVVEPHFQYWPQINNIPEDCFITGYWQSEKYFLGAEAEIRKDFTFIRPLTGKNIGVANKIQQVTAVSLHIRRGDYVNNSKTTARHGLCSLDYYQSAIQYIVNRVSFPIFFIFSDDIAWAKNNLNIKLPCQYIDHNHGSESYNDMRLMSLCQHHIIANSSFSWWGAWLNPRQEKIVVAPKRWFANASNVSTLLPPKWISL